MKNFKFFALMAAMSAMFAFSSCSDDFDLDAYFVTEFDEYEVGEIIYFDNYSRNAESCYWDFGDRYYTDLWEPEHYYTEPGTYTVWLTVYEDEEEDDFKKVIRIYPKRVDTSQDETTDEQQ